VAASVFRRLGAALLLGAFLLPCPAPADEPTAIREGAGRFLYQDPAAATGKRIPVWYYRPKGFGPETPILFVMHGVKRNADQYRDNWIELAETHRLLIVAPEFSNADFPKSWAYNLGNVVTRGPGDTLTPNPESAWSFPLIDRVFGEVRRLTGSKRTRFAIFGHSAGAQFVHRYMTYTGGPLVDLAIAANAGWYTLPSDSETFPYGLGGTKLTEGNVKTAFGEKVVILLGEADTVQDKYFRMAPEAMRQGATRLDRGKSYFAAARREAEKLDTPFNWRLVLVPGVGHDNAKMAGTAAALVAETIAAPSRGLPDQVRQ
jgi:hypothetical protein